MAPEIRYEVATRAHVDELAPRLRPEDVAEVLALGRESAHDALLHSLEVSEMAFALRIGGRLTALFGVAPFMPMVGNVWLLTGPEVAKHPKTFMRESCAMVELLLRYYEQLINVVDARYSAALRWLRWLGFSVGPAGPVAPVGQLFHPVSVWRASWVPPLSAR